MIGHNRNYLVWFALLSVLAVALAACGGGESGVDLPAVRLHVGDKTYTEDVYSYCWPQSATNLTCDLNAQAMAQPKQVAPVAPGDEVRFSIEGEDRTPAAFTATLLDGPGGVQDLAASTNGAYSAQLPAGQYRVQVNVEYADVDGKQAYVTYIFGLSMQEMAIAGQPTPGATEPAAAGTEAVTAVVTEAVPTEELVPATEALPAASEELPAATEQVPTATDTLTKVPPTATATAQPTEQATEAAAPLGTEASGPAVVAQATEISTEAAESPTATPQAAPKASATPEETEPPIGVPEVTPTRALPGATPTRPAAVASPTPEAPLPSATPTALPPTPAPTNTRPAPAASPTPTAAQRATATVAPASVSESDIPALVLTFAGRDHSPVGYEACAENAAGEQTCQQFPGTAPDPRRIDFLRGAAAQLRVEGERPQSVRLEYLSDTGLMTGQPEVLNGDNTVLFTITPEAGTYILAVRVTWTDQVVTYFFRVAVSD